MVCNEVTSRERCVEVVWRVCVFTTLCVCVCVCLGHRKWKECAEEVIQRVWEY